MHIILKNKDTLLYDKFEFKCSIGKNGLTTNKKEGDKKTPKGSYSLGPLFYRNDKVLKPIIKLKKKIIKKNMGWCDDTNNKLYNKLYKIQNKKIKHEKMFRNDTKYDLVIPINYNLPKPQFNKGSAIFIHVTKDYKKTNGCIALSKKDLMILIKLINSKTKIDIF